MNGIHPFAIDKSRAALYEGIAVGKVQDWYRLQGKVVEVRYNEANGLEAKRGFDLIDMFGKTYEVKTDNIALTTGRTFISESLRHKSSLVSCSSPSQHQALPMSGMVDGNMATSCHSIRSSSTPTSSSN
jgi:hypothetical protein